MAIDVHQRSADIVVQWAVTLVEPLLSLSRLVALDRQLAQVFTDDLRFALICFGGILANIGGTLPLDDPWRTVSARMGHITIGRSPPPVTGAVRPDGSTFGTWDDSLDVTHLIFDMAELDPSLVALADPLSPESASLVAFSTYRWTAVRGALDALVGLVDAQGLHRAVVDALRWVSHRRRSYGLLVDDLWPVESAYTWSRLTLDVMADRHVDYEAIDRAIRQERIEPGHGSDTGTSPGD